MSEETTLATQDFSTTRASLAPTNLTEALEFSKILATSSFIPKDFKDKPGDILVAIQWGMEIGLAPLQALQNVAVINGRPSIWGDAALALVQGHRDYVRHDEGVKGDGDKMIGWFMVERRGQGPYTVEFSVTDAKVAGLWDKVGPWKTSPKRMLRLRARGFALRDKFADALKGIVTREEAYDSPYLDEPGPIVEAITDPPVGEAEGMKFYTAWKTAGRTKEWAIKYLDEVCGVKASKDIPLSKFEAAMIAAKTPDKPAVEVPAKIVQLFDVLGTPPLQRVELLGEYTDRFAALETHLESQLPAD